MVVDHDEVRREQGGNLGDPEECVAFGVTAPVGEQLGATEIEHVVEGLGGRSQDDRAELGRLLAVGSPVCIEALGPHRFDQFLRARGRDDLDAGKRLVPEHVVAVPVAVDEHPGVAAGQPASVLAQPLREQEAECRVEDERLVAEIDDRRVADSRQVVVHDRRPDAVRDLEELEIQASRAARSDPT